MDRLKSLDSKDISILNALDFNARASDAEIGRKTRMSKQNVRYRISRLKEKGIVNGFYPIIDNGKRGYFYCRLFLSLQNTTPKVEDEMKEYVVNDKKWVWAMIGEGRYEFMMSTWTKNLTEFKDATQDLIFKFGEYIKEKRESIGLSVLHLPFFNSIIKKPDNAVYITSYSGNVELDEKDIAILRELAEDARMPTVDIAEKVGISPNSVKNRIRRMVEKGVLVGFRPDINHRKLGLVHFKVFLYLKDLTRKNYNALKRYLVSAGVNYIVEEIGLSDIDFEIMLGSYDEMFEFMKKLKAKFPRLIRDHDITVLRETIKIGYLPYDDWSRLKVEK